MSSCGPDPKYRTESKRLQGLLFALQQHINGHPVVHLLAMPLRNGRLGRNFQTVFVIIQLQCKNVPAGTRIWSLRFKARRLRPGPGNIFTDAHLGYG